MDKKIWTKPEISVVEFEANEYIAACANTAPSGSGYLVLETNNSSGMQYSYTSPDIDPDSGLFDDTMGNNSVATMEVMPPSDTSTIQLGYLNAVYGAAQDAKWTYDQLLFHPNANGNTPLWSNDCAATDHTGHTPGSATLYNGYFVASNSEDIPDSSSMSATWTNVKLWLQSFGAETPGYIHAVLSDTAHS